MRLALTARCSRVRRELLRRSIDDIDAHELFVGVRWRRGRAAGRPDGQAASAAFGRTPANSPYDEQVLKSGAAAGSAAAPVKPYGNLAATPLVVALGVELLDATTKRARRDLGRGRGVVQGSCRRASAIGRDRDLATPLSAMIVFAHGCIEDYLAARRGV
jgi:hypothetical protein